MTTRKGRIETLAVDADPETLRRRKLDRDRKKRAKARAAAAKGAPAAGAGGELEPFARSATATATTTAAPKTQPGRASSAAPKNGATAGPGGPAIRLPEKVAALTINLVPVGEDAFEGADPADRESVRLMLGMTGAGDLARLCRAARASRAKLILNCDVDPVA